MSPMLKSRWFAALLHAGLWVLLFAIVSGLGRGVPPYAPATRTDEPLPSVIPVSKLFSLFSPEDWPDLTTATNLMNPFYTRHFIPPSVPAPPPPTTRKVTLTYQGFYQAGNSPYHVFIQTDESLFVGPVGAKVLADWFVAEANQQTLLLTNAAGQTNLFPFNAPRQIEVPIP